MTTLDDVLNEVGVEVEEVSNGSSPQEDTIEEKSKKEHAKEFLKQVVEVEESIRPFKEYLKDLKSNYAENDWLSKEEQKALISALRFAQKKPYTRKQFNEALDLVRKEFVPETEGE